MRKDQKMNIELIKHFLKILIRNINHDLMVYD